mgnify:CR=1 FL=1
MRKDLLGGHHRQRLERGEQDTVRKKSMSRRSPYPTKQQLRNRHTTSYRLIPLLVLLFALVFPGANAAHTRMRHSGEMPHSRPRVTGAATPAVLAEVGSKTNGFVHNATGALAMAASEAKVEAQLLAERAKHAAERAARKMAESRAVLKAQASEAAAAGAELAATTLSPMADIGNALEQKMQTLITGGKTAVRTLEKTKRNVEQSLAPMREASARAKSAGVLHKEAQRQEAKEALSEDLPAVQRIKSKMRVMQTNLRHARNESKTLKSSMDHIHWRHQKQVAILRQNISLQMLRLRNISDTARNASGGNLSIAARSITLPPPKPINHSTCASPCPCDDLGFFLCESCALHPTPLSIPAAQAKEQSDESKVTTTYSALRELKHRSHKLEEQCRVEREASEDAHRRSVMLGVALSEAATTLSQYRRMLAPPAETSGEKGSDKGNNAVQGYVLSSMSHIASITKDQNATLKSLAIATEHAHHVCHKWDTAHKMFVAAMKHVRRAPVMLGFGLDI